MESSGNDLKSLFMIFYQVLQFCEGYYTSIDANMLFKSATLLEETYLKLENLGALKEFEIKLNEFFSLKGFHNTSLVFFKDVSQTVLSKYITDNSFTDDQVKIAITKFISYKSEQDLLYVIQNLSTTQHSVEVLKQNTTISQYNAPVYLSNLVKELRNNDGNIKTLESFICKLVSDNKEDGLKVLLDVLCLPSKCEVSMSVQDVISTSVNNLLRDPNSTSLYPCIVGLCEETLCKIVTRWDSFVETIVCIVELSVKKLKCTYSENSYTWTCTETDHGLHFDDIIVLINKLKPLPEPCQHIKQSLLRLRTQGVQVIVEDLLRICKIK